MPDESTKYPVQLNSYALLSPIYLNYLAPPVVAGASGGSQQPPAIYVNNAKIIASHLIQIEPDNYQTLHVIDQPLEFAYLNRKTQIRNSSPLTMAGSKFASVKRPLSLDDLASRSEAAEQAGALQEFQERFGDLQANQAHADLYHARALRAAPAGQPAAPQRVAPLTRDQLNLERLGRLFRQHQQLRGKLFQVNETNSFNTYFLPVDGDELDRLLELPLEGGAQAASALALEAHIIPDQVLFTRLMPLGSAHATLFDRSASGQRVSLGLAKTLARELQAAPLAPVAGDELSRRLLATPLLLQASCAPADPQHPHQHQHHYQFRNGLTSAEILLANIPLGNGVLHLIKRPILVTDTNLLDYINDNDNQLSSVVQALGSRSAAASAGGEPLAAEASVKLNRFRELLARERQVLSTFSSDSTMNRTILAPSDEAFGRLRYDLRALVEADEPLVPAHWDPAYRQDLLERLVKRHVVTQHILTSDLLRAGHAPPVLSATGQPLSFGPANDGQPDGIQVECDGTRARLVQRDLVASNGVLHIVDRVLGEPQETVHSLLSSMVLRYAHQQASISGAGAGGLAELAHLVEASVRARAHEPPAPAEPHTPGARPELTLVSKTIGQYLEELAAANRRQLQLLATSVNISLQLARLASLAEGRDDWNERFKLTDRSFTYFVPSDLAWIKLQQAQPELYRPLMYFLERRQEAPVVGGGEPLGEPVVGEPVAGEPMVGEQPAAVSKGPRSSESSHRLLQVSGRRLD